MHKEGAPHASRRAAGFATAPLVQWRVRRQFGLIARAAIRAMQCGDTGIWSAASASAAAAF